MKKKMKNKLKKKKKEIESQLRDRIQNRNKTKVLLEKPNNSNPILLSDAQKEKGSQIGTLRDKRIEKRIEKRRIIHHKSFDGI